MEPSPPDPVTHQDHRLGALGKRQNQPSLVSSEDPLFLRLIRLTLRRRALAPVKNVLGHTSECPSQQREWPRGRMRCPVTPCVWVGSLPTSCVPCYSWNWPPCASALGPLESMFSPSATFCLCNPTLLSSCISLKRQPPHRTPP